MSEGRFLAAWGVMTAYWDDLNRLLALELPNPDLPAPAAPPDGSFLQRISQEINAYFAGERQRFDLPYVLDERKPFYYQVWRACAQIPYGQTVSYGQLALMVDKPTAARAVGGAMRNNQLPLIVPCHRVIASGGLLGGFAGSCSRLTLANKIRLLELEGLTVTEGGRVVRAPSI